MSDAYVHWFKYHLFHDTDYSVIVGLHRVPYSGDTVAAECTSSRDAAIILWVDSGLLLDSLACSALTYW